MNTSRQVTLLPNFFWGTGKTKRNVTCWDPNTVKQCYQISKILWKIRPRRPNLVTRNLNSVNWYTQESSPFIFVPPKSFVFPFYCQSQDHVHVFAGKIHLNRIIKILGSKSYVLVLRSLIETIWYMISTGTETGLYPGKIADVYLLILFADQISCHMIHVTK